MISPRDIVPAGIAEQLMAAARRRPRRPQGEDVKDYPFDRPNRFTLAQLGRLERFGAKAAEAAAERLGQMLQTPVALGAGRWQQHFAGPLRQAGSESLRHVVAITADGGAVTGWLGISSGSASQWLARLLGGSSLPESDQQNQRDLSDLERDLLLDIAAGIIESIQKPAAEFAGPGLRAARVLSSWPQACAAGETEELCMLELSAQPGAAGQLAILLSAQAAAQLAGDSPAAQPAKGARQAGPAMLAHVERTAVEARAMLSGSLLLRDVMALAPGDVLVMDQRIDDTVDLEAGGKAVMKGYPARQDGYVALRFAEFCKEKFLSRMTQ